MRCKRKYDNTGGTTERFELVFVNSCGSVMTVIWAVMTECQADNCTHSTFEYLCLEPGQMGRRSLEFKEAVPANFPGPTRPTGINTTRSIKLSGSPTSQHLPAPVIYSECVCEGIHHEIDRRDLGVGLQDAFGTRTECKVYDLRFSQR
jgi:hypothetical protein